MRPARRSEILPSESLVAKLMRAARSLCSSSNPTPKALNTPAPDREIYGVVSEEPEVAGTASGTHTRRDPGSESPRSESVAMESRFGLFAASSSVLTVFVRETAEPVEDEHHYFGVGRGTDSSRINSRFKAVSSSFEFFAVPAV